MPGIPENNPVEYRDRLELIEAILVSKFPTLSIEEIREMLDLKTVSIRDIQFYKDMVALERDQWIQEGRHEGQQEGL